MPFFASLLKPGGVLVGPFEAPPSSEEDAHRRRPQGLLKIVKRRFAEGAPFVHGGAALDVGEILPV